MDNMTLEHGGWVVDIVGVKYSELCINHSFEVLFVEQGRIVTLPREIEVPNEVVIFAQMEEWHKEGKVTILLKELGLSS